MARPGEPYTSLNFPEENDETMSDDFESEHQTSQQIILHHHTFSNTRQTPYPGWHNACQYSAYDNTEQRDGSPHSLPSCLPSVVYQTISDGSLFYPSRPHSLPGSLISLEHPQSLHSYVPPAHLYPPNPYLHPVHCRQPQHHHSYTTPGHQMTVRPSGYVVLSQYFNK